MTNPPNHVRSQSYLDTQSASRPSTSEKSVNLWDTSRIRMRKSTGKNWGGSEFLAELRRIVRGMCFRKHLKHGPLIA